MKFKRLILVPLFCLLLLGSSFVPTMATDISSNSTVILRASGRLDHSFSANSITPLGQQFSLDMDEIVAFNCTYTPKSASMDFGYIDSNNVFHYLNCTSGSIEKSFELARAGQYTLAIRNNASYAVTVTGTVRY